MRIDLNAHLPCDPESLQLLDEDQGSPIGMERGAQSKYDCIKLNMKASERVST